MRPGIKYPAYWIPLVSNSSVSTFNQYTILAFVCSVQYQLWCIILYNLSYLPFKGEWEWERAGPDYFKSLPLHTDYTSHAPPSLYIVFAGPVFWTEKKTEIELNPTAIDQTTGCSCTNSEIFRLPIARFVKKSKNRKKNRSRPVATGH